MRIGILLLTAGQVLASEGAVSLNNKATAGAGSGSGTEALAELEAKVAAVINRRRGSSNSNNSNSGMNGNAGGSTAVRKKRPTPTPRCQPEEKKYYYCPYVPPQYDDCKCRNMYKKREPKKTCCEKTGDQITDICDDLD